LLVREIMSRPVFTVRSTDTLREAWELMRDQRIRHLPVVDESGRLVGIVTDRDLRGASPSKLIFHEKDLALLEAPISTVMSQDVETAHPLDPIEETALTLVKKKIGALPVVDTGNLVGIVTTTDLLRALVELLRVDTPSSRIDVEVEDRVGAVHDLTGIFKELGLSLSSLILYPAEHTGRRRVVLRVMTIDPTPALKRLREIGSREGIRLLWPVEAAETPQDPEGETKDASGDVR